MSNFIAGFFLGGLAILVLEVYSGPDYLRMMADHIEENKQRNKQ